MDILPETPGPLILDVRQNGAGPGPIRTLLPELSSMVIDEVDDHGQDVTVVARTSAAGRVPAV